MAAILGMVGSEPMRHEGAGGNLPRSSGWGTENERWRDSLALNVLGLTPGGALATRSRGLLAVVLTGIAPARLGVAE